MRQIILAINALLKFKAYTLINVLGLACSLACVLTVARYIHQENTVNQCFPEYKRICLIKTSTSSGENFLGGYRSGLEKDPAVEQFTVIYQISDMPVLFGEQEIAANAPLTFDLFAVAVAITTAISLLTIIGQISKAANINPASIMKNE